MAQDKNDILWDKLKDSKIAMMTSICRDTELHSRPMMTAQNSFDGTLYFYSRLSSEKIDEVSHNPNILLTYSNPKEMTFVSVYGMAGISRNPSKLREHWTPKLEAFFEQGVNDPDLCLIEVRVESAEYWDSDQSQMTRIFEMVKASITGKSPNLGDHRIMKM